LNDHPKYLRGIRFSGRLTKDEVMLYIPKNHIHIR
jgi:hypothetical protein